MQESARERESRSESESRCGEIVHAHESENDEVERRQVSKSVIKRDSGRENEKTTYLHVAGMCL